MSFPAPENLPHDDWFMDSIPMQEWPPNSGKHNHPLPTYKDKDGNDICINKQLIKEGHAYTYDGGKKKVFTS